jgi:hypothetical protein
VILERNLYSRVHDLRTNVPKDFQCRLDVTLDAALHAPVEGVADDTAHQR